MRLFLPFFLFFLFNFFLLSLPKAAFAATPAIDLSYTYSGTTYQAGANTAVKRIAALGTVTSSNPVRLSWTISNSPTSCTYHMWNYGGTGDHNSNPQNGATVNDNVDSGWKNLTSTAGGSYNVTVTPKYGNYTYSISCSNASGDSSGDLISFFVTGETETTGPSLSNMNVTTPGGTTVLPSPSSNPVYVTPSASITMSWALAGPSAYYLLCASSGSYINWLSGNSAAWTSNSKPEQHAQIYCSNEFSAAKFDVLFNLDQTPPTVPGTPAVTSPPSTQTPTWSWSASTDSQAGLANPAYTIQWSQSQTFASGITSATTNATTFTNPSALAYGTWYARVKAQDLAGNSSAYSSAGSVTIQQLPGSFVLSNPSILDLGCNGANSTVNLNWNAASNVNPILNPSTDFYQAFRSTDQLSWTAVGPLIYNFPPAPQPIDTTALSHTTYYYKVKAFNQAGTNDSNILSITTMDCAAPTVSLNSDKQTVYLGQNYNLNWSFSALKSSSLSSPPPIPAPDQQPSLLHLQRFFNSNNNDHWSTTSIESPQPNQNYSIDTGFSNQGYLLQSDDGTGLLLPFYNCTANDNNKLSDRFNYTGPGCDRYVNNYPPGTKHLIGYIYMANKPRTTPLFHCFSPTFVDAMLISSDCGSITNPDFYSYDYKMNGNTGNGGYQGRTIDVADDRQIRPPDDTSLSGYFHITSQPGTPCLGTQPQVTISWTPTNFGTNTYQVFRTTDGGVTQTKIADNFQGTNFIDPANINVGSPPSLQVGHTYNYHIVAVGGTAYYGTASDLNLNPYTLKYDAGWAGGTVVPDCTQPQGPTPVADTQPATLQLSRYFNGSSTVAWDHWSTTSLQTSLNSANNPLSNGYVLETSSPVQIHGYLLSSDDGTGLLAPLYDCTDNLQRGTNGTKPNEHYNIMGLNGCQPFLAQNGGQGSTAPVILGYIYTGYHPNTKPQYTCYQEVTAAGSKLYDRYLLSNLTCDTMAGDLYVDYGFQGYSLVDTSDRMTRPVPPNPSPPGSFQITSPAIVSGPPSQPLINFSWTPSSFNTYKIFRTTNGGTTQTKIADNFSGTSFTDPTNINVTPTPPPLVAGNTYNYHVVTTFQTINRTIAGVSQSYNNYYDAGWTGATIAIPPLPSANTCVATTNPTTGVGNNWLGNILTNPGAQILTPGAVGSYTHNLACTNPNSSLITNASVIVNAQTDSTGPTVSSDVGSDVGQKCYSLATLPGSFTINASDPETGIAGVSYQLQQNPSNGLCYDGSAFTLDCSSDSADLVIQNYTSPYPTTVSPTKALPNFSLLNQTPPNNSYSLTVKAINGAGQKGSSPAYNFYVQTNSCDNPKIQTSGGDVHTNQNINLPK